MKTKIYQTDTFILISLCLLGGLYSLLGGQDANWDLLNYHIYNAFSLLNGHFYQDVMPAGIHTFLNPLLDVPYYLMLMTLNNWPRLIAFLQGIWGGLLWFAGYKLCLLFLEEQSGKLPAAIAAAAGLTSSMILSQIGLASNEIPLACLVCAATYGVFKLAAGKNTSSVGIVLSALTAGAAVGLKYTAAPFVIALTAVFFANVKQTNRPLKNILLFALAGIAGFLLTNGYFMWRLWSEYQNPLFPFFNHIFQSPYFENINFTEERFFPRSWLQALAYPFFWVKESLTVTEITAADPRMALGYISFFVAGALLLFKKIPQPKARLLGSTLLYMAVAYLLWLCFYSTLRYAIMLDVMSIILVTMLLRYYFSYKTTAIIGTLLAFVLWNTTEIPNWGKDGFSKQAIVFYNMPQVEENALVVYFGAPMAFLSPFFPEGTSFAGGIKFPIDQYPPEYQKRAKQRNGLPPQYYAYKFDERLQEKINSHDGPIYIVAVSWPMMLDPITLAPFGLEKSDEKCKAFNASINLYSKGWELCKVNKIAPETKDSSSKQ